MKWFNGDDFAGTFSVVQRTHKLHCYVKAGVLTYIAIITIVIAIV